MKRPAFLERSDLGRGLWLFRREFAWVAVFSFFANVLLLSPTLYMMQVYDRVVISQNELTLLALTSVIALFIGAMAFAQWIRTRLLVRAGVRFDEFLNAKVFRATFEANLRQGPSSALRTFNDLTNLRQFLTGAGVFAFFDAPWSAIFVVLLFVMHPLLGWVSFVFMVALIAIAWAGHRLTAHLYERASDGSVQANIHLQSRLRNAESVEAMGMLGNLRRQWLALYEKQLAGNADAQARARHVQAITKFVSYTQQSLILAVGAWLVIRGELSMGTMIASNALMSNALRPVSTLVATWKQFIEARQAYGRLERLLEDYPERDTDLAPDEIAGAITLRGLVATTPNRERPILSGLDAEFEAGEIVAITGPSGAGKSTLARCLVGVWPHVEGQVLLDGRPIHDWSREHLGPHVGYLPQDIELFDGTIAENIARFGDIDSGKVIEAAKRTGIHDMILRLPKGYDTPMGFAGNVLSGGQRQRIGLARALYGNPDLIVLDEPNANLDDIGLAALARTLQELRERGATVFMVVHQRNLLALADRLLVLQQGAIAQLAKLAKTGAAPA